MNLILPSIMQSIKPQYCELIAAGKKTIEVRKTRPKLKPPFKVYIYETKFINHCRDCEYCSFESIVMGRMKDVCKWEEDNWKITSPSSRCFQNKYSGGKVIGEYICDEIEEIKYDNNISSYTMFYDDLKATCLSYNELFEYGKYKTLYLWHITDLKIYDEPKELSDFYTICNKDDLDQCGDCKYIETYGASFPCEDGGDWVCTVDNKKPLTRPPQSWCYVEAI